MPEYKKCSNYNQCDTRNLCSIKEDYIQYSGDFLVYDLFSQIQQGVKEPKITKSLNLFYWDIYGIKLRTKNHKKLDNYLASLNINIPCYTIYSSYIYNHVFPLNFGVPKIIFISCLNYYLHLIYGEPNSKKFYDCVLSNLTTIEKKKELKTIAFKEYPRNEKLKEICLKQGNNSCYINKSHLSFLNKKNQNYMEAHHLVPLSNHDEFEYSLDIIENLISLCPNCHKMLHNANFKVIRPILESLYNSKITKLKQKGISLTLEDFFNLYK